MYASIADAPEVCCAPAAMHGRNSEKSHCRIDCRRLMKAFRPRFVSLRQSKAAKSLAIDGELTQCGAEASGQLQRVVIGPEVHEVQARVFAEHVAVNSGDLDAALLE